MGRRVVIGLALAVAGLVASSMVPVDGARSAASALLTFDVPWSDEAPRWESAEGVLRTAALGVPDPRVRRLAPARASARVRARDRALAALHRFVDEALARRRLPPWWAARVHRTVDEGSRIVGRRPLADGAVVLVVDVPGEALRAAAPPRGMPWAP